MNILIAPDAFKGSLSAFSAAQAMAAGLAEARPEASIRCVPLADGGEGTLNILLQALGGVRIACDDGDYGLSAWKEQRLAIIEAARFIGLDHPAMRRAILHRGTGAIGRAILSALHHGATEIWVALGGTATNDGGLGMLICLGAVARDEGGRRVSPDLAGLMRLDSIDLAPVRACLAECRITMLADVAVPLVGPDGATHRFGPQKGLHGEALHRAERAMTRWVQLNHAEMLAGSAGAGAAGGLGFALKLIGAHCVSGAEAVMDAVEIDRHLSWADQVITGEGCSDAQTLSGKLPYRLAQRAKRHGRPVTLVAGRLKDQADLEKVFDQLLEASPRELPLSEACTHAAELIRQAVASGCRFQ